MAGKAADPRYMKEYLQFALQFEKNYYIWNHALQEVNNSMQQLYSRRQSLQVAIPNLQRRYNTIDRDVRGNVQPKADGSKHYRAISKIALVFMVSILVISVLFGIVLAIAFAKDSEGTHRLVGIPVVFMSLFIGAMIVCPVGLPIYAISRSKAKSAGRPMHSAEYEERFKQRDKKKIVNDIQIAQQDLQANYDQEVVFSARQEEIVSAFQIAKSNLNNLYAENVLPDKYRNWNAVATMYGYLVTGRCNTIQGHGGIYDTYEHDVQQGIIISNLQEINAQLGEISENQRMIYQELSQANRTLSSIQSSLSSIEKYSAQTAKNTAISAAADQQTAESARWMAWRMWANGY